MTDFSDIKVIRWTDKEDIIVTVNDKPLSKSEIVDLLVEYVEENKQLKSTLYYLLNVIQNKCPKNYPKCKKIVRKCFENDFNNTENDRWDV